MPNGAVVPAPRQCDPSGGGEPEAALRPAAAHRRAMDLSDQWVREGCQPDSRLLPLEHAALVRSYAALLAAVHR